MIFGKLARQECHRGSTSRQSRRRRLAKWMSRYPQLEVLEDRRLLAIDLSGVATWIGQGSQPITAATAADLNGPSSGAVEDLAVDPNDPSHMFAATVNGGIWRTGSGDLPFNGLDDNLNFIVDDPDEQPFWTPVTDQYPSLAMGGIAFDPLDVSGNTVFAGTGSTSSLGNVGGAAIGIMKTTDNGESWSVFPLEPGGNDPRVRTVLPTTYDASGDPGVQQVVLVGTVSGLYRSTDGGETYAKTSAPLVGLPNGPVTDIISDPNDNSVYYAGVVSRGVFRTDDGGANWTDVNNADLSTNASLGDSKAVMLSAHPSGGTTRIYAMVSYQDDGMDAAEVPQVFRSDDDGASWTELADAPDDMASGNGGLYISRASDQIIVDPSDEDIVYIAKGYGGSPMMYRYNPSGGGGWVQIEDVAAVGNTSPHVDHRDLQFVRSGGNDVLINTNDGGIYFLVDPQSPDRWVGLHGLGDSGLGTTEYTNVTWDTQFDVVFGGAQDNGTSVQTSTGDTVWKLFRGSDGGDVQAADAGGGNSYRYSATQPPNDHPNHSPISRHEFSSATTEVGGAVNLFPIAGLPDFIPRFVAQFELNSVNPRRLVVGGGGASPVYELTNADTATGPGDASWDEVPTGPGFMDVNSNGDAAFVVGGRMGGVDNEEVLIVASGEDIFIRSAAGGTLTVTPTSFPGGKVEAIAVDPENWQHMFVADSDQVWETPDAGSTWTDVTRNLGKVNARLQSLAYVPTAEEDVILVGGNLGVARLTIGEPEAQWTRLSANLPNASANDLEYHASDDVLIVGTFGRGAWLIENASTVVDDVGVLTICGDEDHVNQDDVFRLVRNALNPLILDVFLNSVAPVFNVPLAALSQINVFGVGGNDELIVDVSNGLIDVPQGIRYDGDGTCYVPPNGDQEEDRTLFGFDRGFDTLTITTDDTDTAFDTEEVAVGQLPGSGRHTLSGSSGSQTVWFEELEPVTTIVNAATLAITSLPGLASLLQDDNEINYEPVRYLVPMPAA